MEQVGDLVKAAFYRAGLRDNQMEINGDDMARGVTVLNSMMHRLQADSMLVSWEDAVNATDTLYILKKQERPLTYILAVELCAEYQTAPSELLVKFYNDSLADMARDAVSAAPNVGDVSHMPATGDSSFDIVSGQ